MFDWVSLCLLSGHVLFCVIFMEKVWKLWRIQKLLSDPVEGGGNELWRREREPRWKLAEDWMVEWLIYGQNDRSMVEEGLVTLAGDGQNGRRVFSLVKEDGRLIGCLQLDLGGAWWALRCGWLALLATAAAAVHECLTESLKHVGHKQTSGYFTTCFS